MNGTEIIPEDKVIILKKNGAITGFSVNGKEYIAEMAGNVGRIQLNLEDLPEFNLSLIPENFFLELFAGGNIIDFCMPRYVAEGEADVQYIIYRDSWEHKFGANEYMNAFKKSIEVRSKTSKDVLHSSIVNSREKITCEFEVLFAKDLPINIAYEGIKEIIGELEGHTERLLEKEIISSVSLEKEEKFTTDVLLPLFRSMGFIDVRYNHGKHEFGKDITFSEIDKFGITRNYGVQVKAGDLSGRVGSGLNDLIEQIDNALSISYIDTINKERKNISFLIIAISGRFTNNAKEIILQKVKQHNVYFFDIDKIKELIVAYTKLKIL